MKYSRDDAKFYARQHMVGIWAAIPYPFSTDGEIDEAGLRANVRRYIDGLKLEGIFCGQFMSEFASLTQEERKRAAEIILDEAAGAVPVIVHTGHHSAKESVNLTEHAEEAGATYAAIGNPYFLAHTDGGIFDYFRYISDRTQIGILAVNTPFTGISLAPDMINRLAELTNVVAVKNAQPLNHTLEVIRLAGDRIVVSDPDERNWLMLMLHFGLRLYMASPVPYLLQRPGHTLMKDYTALAVDGDPAQAAALAYELEPARRVHEKWLSRPWATRKVMPIAYLKAWCELMGMAGGPVRPPLEQITQTERQELRADLEAVGLAS